MRTIGARPVGGALFSTLRTQRRNGNGKAPRGISSLRVSGKDAPRTAPERKSTDFRRLRSAETRSSDAGERYRRAG